jgi:DNA-binding NarL/FixJ family response regulator
VQAKAVEIAPADPGSYAELLAEARKRHPQAVRIILSGQSDEGQLRAVGTAHQYLSKPCDPLVLKGAIARAFVLRDRLENESIGRLVSQM